MNAFNSNTFNIVPSNDITAQEFTNIIENIMNLLNERRSHIARKFNVKYMLFPVIHFGQNISNGTLHQSTSLGIEFFSFPSGMSTTQSTCYSNVPGEEFKIFVIECTSIGDKAVREYCVNLVNQPTRYQPSSSRITMWNNFQVSQKIVLHRGVEYKTSIGSLTYNKCDRFNLWELYKIRGALEEAGIHCVRLKSSELIRLNDQN
jgi:hypothetical protein